MKRIIGFLAKIFHMCFRHIDFPTKLRLIRIGNPDENSPVFMSGNYIYTVKRLEEILKDADCYLLVAKSSGSNVWCAAGMEEFTEHDVIDSINFTSINELVNHRIIILPPTAAVGIDKKKVKESTGWNIKWGPCHFKYLSEYIKNGFKKDDKMRRIPFPLRDRIEMALGTATMTILTPLLLSLFIWRGFLLPLAAVITAITLLNFILYPVLPEEKYFRRTLLVTALFLGIGAGIGLLLNLTLTQMLIWGGIITAVTFISCADMCGSTPLVKTTITNWLKTGNYKSLFQPVINPGECTGCRSCIDICPKDVYRVKGKKVVAANTEECFECLACIKQCPVDAIYNVNPGKYKKDIRSIENIDFFMKRPFPVSGNGRKKSIKDGEPMETTIIPVTCEVNKFLKVNVFFLVGEKIIIVDSGVKDSHFIILNALKKHGIDKSKVSLILLTHAHPDHCLGARKLKEALNVPVAISKGEAPYLEQGNFSPVIPTGITGKLVFQSLKPLHETHDDTFIPENIFEKELILDKFGVRGKAIVTPGHSVAGSSIILDTGGCIVGDLLVESPFGSKPDLPPFAVDIKKLKESLKKLFSYNINDVYTSHGSMWKADIVEKIINKF